ncbi:MAG: hypothetical protein ACRDZO_10655, partial [Egibacteraceae bacterium]
MAPPFLDGPRLALPRGAVKASVDGRLPPDRPPVPVDVTRHDLARLLARIADREPHLERRHADPAGVAGDRADPCRA